MAIIYLIDHYLIGPDKGATHWSGQNSVNFMHTQAEDVPILTSKQLKVQVFMKRDKVRPHLLLHIATVQQ